MIFKWYLFTKSALLLVIWN